MTDYARQAEARQRYQTAAHRVQTIIAAMPGHRNQQTKHLRVGIDMSKPDFITSAAPEHERAGRA